MATTSRRPAARRRPARRTTTYRRPARRHKNDGALAAGVICLVLAGLALKWLADNPIVIALVILAAAAVIAIVIARKAQARQRYGQLMADRAHIAHYMTMTPKDFEHAIAYLCQRDGCTNVKVVGGAGDLGADVIATTPTGQRIVIQAKRYAATNRVGSPDLQKVGGTARQVHGAHMVAAVTTSGFTKAARDYAAHPQVGIRLVDHDALAQWAARSGPAPWH